MGHHYNSKQPVYMKMMNQFIVKNKIANCFSNYPS